MWILADDIVRLICEDKLAGVTGGPFKLDSVSASAEISGQSSECLWSAETLIWRGVQMCSIILQLGFLPFDEGSPACNGGLAIANADWKSFEQSVGPPGAR